MFSVVSHTRAIGRIKSVRATARVDVDITSMFDSLRWRRYDMAYDMPYPDPYDSHGQPWLVVPITELSFWLNFMH